jgi:predicted nuclease of predicted toxin-antitoxin system
LEKALTESRLLLTFDKDFGELVFHKGAKASCGIILFRISIPSPAKAAEKVVTSLESRSDWENHFSVVEDAMVRMRPLPD